MTPVPRRAMLNALRAGITALALSDLLGGDKAGTSPARDDRHPLPEVSGCAIALRRCLPAIIDPAVGAIPMAATVDAMRARRSPITGASAPLAADLRPGTTLPTTSGPVADSYLGTVGTVYFPTPEGLRQLGDPRMPNHRIDPSLPITIVGPSLAGPGGITCAGLATQPGRPFTWLAYTDAQRRVRIPIDPMLVNSNEGGVQVSEQAHLWVKIVESIAQQTDGTLARVGSLTWYVFDPVPPYTTFILAHATVDLDGLQLSSHAIWGVSEVALTRNGLAPLGECRSQCTHLTFFSGNSVLGLGDIAPQNRRVVRSRAYADVQVAGDGIGVVVPGGQTASRRIVGPEHTIV